MINPMHPLQAAESVTMTVFGWLVEYSTPSLDLAAILALLTVFVIVLYAATGDLPGQHRRRDASFPPLAPDHVQVIRRSVVVEEDGDVMTIAIPEHEGATEDWHPVQESRAADTPDAEWRQIMEMAEREREQWLADIRWTPLDWSAVDAAIAPAERWHAEHGRHCACCHVDDGHGGRHAIATHWRTSENTIEIKRDVILAASGMH